MKLITMITILLGFCIIFNTTTLSAYRGSFNQKNIDINEFIIKDSINQINESRLNYFYKNLYYFYKNLLNFGVRYTGTPNCSKAGDWIYDEFEKMGLDVEFHEWNYDIYESRNIVATIPGNDQNSNAIYMLCARSS